MKNFLILGLLAVLLFSVSAALSLWLNQAKQTETASEKDKVKDNEKGGAKGPKEVVDKTILPKTDDSPGALDSSAILRDREARLQYRQAQIELVERDLQVQREATDVTLSKVLAEAKNLGAETAKLELIAKDIADKQGGIDADEKKNVEKIAALYDGMAPESAAPVIKDMVEKGKLDLAAKILLQMKQRNASRVLDTLNDPTLADQIFSRMEKLRTNKTTPPGTPAKGP